MKGVETSESNFDNYATPQRGERASNPDHATVPSLSSATVVIQRYSLFLYPRSAVHETLGWRTLGRHRRTDYGSSHDVVLMIAPQATPPLQGGERLSRHVDLGHVKRVGAMGAVIFLPVASCARGCMCRKTLEPFCPLHMFSPKGSQGSLFARALLSYFSTALWGNFPYWAFCIVQDLIED